MYKKTIAIIKQVWKNPEKAEAMIKKFKHNKRIKINESDKNRVIKELENILSGKSVGNPITNLILLSSGKIDLDKTQKNQLTKLLDIIKSEKPMKCNHKIHVYALMNGGGFWPNYLRAELYCPDCNLNITLESNEEIDKIIVDANLRSSINKWIQTLASCNKVKWISVSEITNNPKNVMKNAPKYQKSLKGLKILV